jgi:hypothetical protein
MEPHAARPIRTVVGRVGAAAAGLVVVWLSLQLFGQYLAGLPDASHERVLWRDDPLEQEGP